MALADWKDRHRFCHEWHRNFLAIAPAGVGKTTAIAERVARMALAPNGKDLIGELAVVTFTRKAAGEIRQRVGARLRAMGAGSGVETILDGAFFGTIDAFFSSLLGEFGEIGGNGAAPKIVDVGSPAEKNLWWDFLEDEAASWDIFMAQPHLGRLLQLCPWKTLAEMAHDAAPLGDGDFPIPEFPEIPWQRLLPDGDGDGLPQILRDQIAIVRSWRDRLMAGHCAPLALSERWSGKALGGVPFSTLCEELWLCPVARWAEVVGGILCGRLAEAYGRYRRRSGFATYGDLRLCAHRLLDGSEVLSELRRRNYRIIVDEAQDTAPEDIRFFLKLVPQDGGVPAMGHLSMVGDLQQCIYLGGDGEFGEFKEICTQLVDCGALERLTFTVTMRCPKAVAHFANGTFPPMLNGGDQAEFVPMECPSGAASGAVYGMQLNLRRTGAVSRTVWEMEALAEQFVGKTPEDFSASCWGEVAILGGVRKVQLLTLQRIFDGLAIPAQLRLRGQRWGSRLFFRNLCGVLRIICCPTDYVEIVSVLREVFAVSDGEIAKFLQGSGGKLLFESMLDGDGGGDGQLWELLRALGALRREVLSMDVVGALFRLDGVLRLRERANRCEGKKEEENAALWWDVVSFAYDCAARGEGLAEFCEALLLKYFDGCERTGARKDHIQIDTLHGSKGLEWDCVIVAFCGRPLVGRRTAVPLHCSVGGEPRLFLRSEGESFVRHLSSVEDDNLRARQRLLYVAMTRARKTLILAKGGSAEKADRNSPEALMAIDFSKLTQWEGMVPAAVGKVELDPLPPPFAGTPAATIWRGARVRATASGGKVVDGDAVAYGAWWHRAMEHFPWNERGKHGDHLAAAIASAPNAERAQGEIAALLASKWYGSLDFDSLRFFAEWPYADEIGGRSGKFSKSIVDLIIFDRRANSLTVVDWKTDQIAFSAVGAAMERHGEQLRRYGSFFRSLGSWDVSTAIYFSAVGAVVFY
ncbi:MAG: UvrD-helicase domain-containing protein [Puniceicoccales bacterium]|jgi:superfamily I DNA/RNA helicase|nr:UvrD-helicase domain-containing protein [Puniceicoccales bacterium]